jgi:hypothetical protein
MTFQMMRKKNSWMAIYVQTKVIIQVISRDGWKKL